MERIYHHFDLWEDHKHGFYDNCSGAIKQEKIEKVLEMFNNKQWTRQYMMRVIDEWKYSCEQNLTNEAMNKIAYLGQGACCLFADIPSTVTMEAWSLLPKEIRDRADKIAEEVLNIWLKRNKGIQLCLNID